MMKCTKYRGWVKALSWVRKGLMMSAVLKMVVVADWRMRKEGLRKMLTADGNNLAMSGVWSSQGPY